MSAKTTSIFFKTIPYLFIIFINDVIAFLFDGRVKVYISFDLITLIILVYFLSDNLKNFYNQIITKGWILFFILGIFNMNSSQLRTNIWKLDIHEASLLYFTCLFAFNLGLILFEKIESSRNAYKKRIFFNDFKELTFSSFSFLLLIYPLLLFATMYKSIGYIPLLMGKSFVDQMYNLDYGSLYGFKFFCIYSFLISFLIYKKDYKILTIIYIAFLFFVISIDGKRFVMLLCILSIIPIFYFIKEKVELKSISLTPIILAFSGVFVIYVLLNILRSGGDLVKSTSLIIENIPFGVEYKDFVHSFNTYEAGDIKDYNFELSSLGAFFNSSILALFGLDKNELVYKGSAHIWMKLYNEEFGIRTGIISELYFAYGYFVIPIMFIIAYFTNKINYQLLFPKSYFHLIQNSILFALIFLSINGQATVFFGCLTMMIYIYILYRLLNIKSIKGLNNDFYSYNRL